MTALGLAVTELYRSEQALARLLRAVAARHHCEQDVHHLALDLAGWSDDHARRLVEHGVGPMARAAWSNHGFGVLDVLRARLSDALTRRPEPSLLLLADLRRVHRAAAGVSLDWELLAQGAQAVKMPDLLTLTERCHPQTLRQMRWANAMVKELAPQVLAN